MESGKDPEQSGFGTPDIPESRNRPRQQTLVLAGVILAFSLVYFVLLYVALHFVRSSALSTIGIVFVSYIAWRNGAVAGLALVALNHLWTSTAFLILAPEFTRSYPPEAIISILVHVGVALLLGYFGRLAADLRKEIEVRKMAEASLMLLQNELEQRVETRTRELDKVNEFLTQARKMEAIGHLAGSIAHDFNNYLNIILGYSALLVKKLEPNSPPRDWAINVEKAAATAAELTSQLLAFSRKKKFPVRPVNLNTLIEELIPLLSSAVKHSITISHVADAQLPVFEGGVDQIKSALLNLGLNARDAMKNGGALTISTKTVDVTEAYCRKHGLTCPTGTFASVSVADTGTGIEPEAFKHLFEPFFTTKDEGKGTGMGLAAVFGIAQNHHGAVFAETELGSGTTFTMLFPVKMLETPA